jgi:hypothetical protein
MVRKLPAGGCKEPATAKKGLKERLFGQGSKPPEQAEVQGPQFDFSEFDNPVYRHEFLGTATKEQLAKICDVFMAGNWYVFGVWASLALEGRLPTQDGKPGTPHGEFWAKVLSAPKDERDGFLTFLLRSGLADTGIRYRPVREPPAKPGSSSLLLLRSYFEAFRDPSHSADERAALGSRLVWYGNYPEERMVRLAPLLGERALLHLERFMNVKRRFFKLHTDYSTDLEELDGLFLECLRALLELAADGALRERVMAILERSREDHSKRPCEPSGGPSTIAEGTEGSEAICVESLHDNMGMSPSTVNVGQGVLPDQLTSGRGPLSKVRWLELAILALGGEVAAQKRFFEGGERPGRQDELAGAHWSLPVDDGAGRIAGDRLFYMCHFLFDGKYHLPTLSSIHIPTGRTRYMLNLGDRSSRGLSVCGETLMVGPGGTPVLMAQLDREDGPRTYRLITFDAQTGQVTTTEPLALEPDKEAALLSATDDGYILTRGRLVWKQGMDGALGWRTELPAADCFAISGGRAVLLGKDELVLLALAEPGKALRRPRAELEKEAGGGFQPDILMHQGGFYLFDDNRTIYSFDERARFLWKHSESEDHWLGMPKRWGEGLSYVNFKRFCLISPEGKMAHEFPTPGRPHDYIVDGEDVFYFTEDALWHWRPGMNEAKKALGAPINHMAKPLGVCGGKLLLLFYTDHYYMAAIEMCDDGPDLKKSS